MPYSGITFDVHITLFIQEKKYKYYLDIGCGAGKYAKLIRSLFTDAHITGVEIDHKYIHDFKLYHLYDQLYNCDIIDFCKNNLEFTTDLCIIGDCIEHLWKSEGINLLNFLVYRTKYILLIFPSNYIQFGTNGHDAENHISVWSEHDFNNFEHQYHKQGDFNFVLIKGYQS